MDEPILSAGLGLKPEHYEDALASRAEGLWFEVHAENYMVDGGPRLAWLEAIRSRHPVSLHGVALSLGADDAPDPHHLARLAKLVRRFEPALVSEHLAWNTRRGHYRPDLLPFPRTVAALERFCTNVSIAQDALGRAIAIENPSHYLRMDRHELGETDFLGELARRTGCALLLDLNNVHVSAANLGESAEAYLERFPVRHVTQIHLAGHSRDETGGRTLLVDSHDAPVAPAVWSLFEKLVARIGPRPTLIERDGNLPSFGSLLSERERAQAVLASRPALAA